MVQWAATVSQPSVMAVAADDQIKVMQDVVYNGDGEDEDKIIIVASLKCEICGDYWSLGSRNVRNHEQPTRVQHVMVLNFEGTPVEGAFAGGGKPRLYAARDGSG